MENCVFCKIIKGELPSTKRYEDEDFIIIDNINPLAKFSYLAIPKNHYGLLKQATTEDSQVLGKILKKIPELEAELNLKDGYRLIVNQGENGGQEIAHLHIHILSGEKLGWPNGIKPDNK
ncbi:MAG: HIT domain-containing protein [Clostridia bacterium]|nr:HIT domain-containing protein [Clostridia bacterium]